MAKPAKKYHGTVHAVKGSIAPLSSAQRELVSMFVEYLRGLPAWNQKTSWDSHAYSPVLTVVTKHFKNTNPGWGAGEIGRPCIGDLPEAQCALFEFLMHHASNAEDPLNARQKQLRGVAQLKELVYGAVRIYDRERAKLGLPVEILLVGVNGTGSRGRGGVHRESRLNRRITTASR